MKLKLLSALILVVMSGGFLIPAYAVTTITTGSDPAAQTPIPQGCPGSTQTGGTNVSSSVCDAVPIGCPGSTAKSTTQTYGCPYYSATSGINNTGDGGGLYSKYLNPFIVFLSGAVGVIVVISIIVGGIQYSSAGGDAQKVASARNRIKNAILALIAFIFLRAILNWIIPNGIG